MSEEIIELTDLEKAEYILKEVELIKKGRKYNQSKYKGKAPDSRDRAAYQKWYYHNITKRKREKQKEENERNT